MIAPERVAVSWFWAKEVLVGSGGLGVSRIFPENLPPQALLSPFSPLFLPLHLSFNSLTFQNPLSNSLDPAFYRLFYPYHSFFPPPTPFYLPQPFLSPLSDPLRTPPESLHKLPKRPKIALFSPFRGFPLKPLKGPKTPFLGPF